MEWREEILYTVGLILLSIIIWLVGFCIFAYFDHKKRIKELESENIKLWRENAELRKKLDK